HGLKYLPVQDSGRLKPYDTFARESLELVYGKDTYEGKPAHEVLLTWLLEPTSWEKKPVFQIVDPLVKRGLDLDEKKKFFSPEEVLKSERLSTLMQELASKRESKEKLDPYMQALQRLETQIFLLRGMASGLLLHVAPPAKGAVFGFGAGAGVEVPNSVTSPGVGAGMALGADLSWLSVAALPPDLASAFADLTRAFVRALNKPVESPELEDSLQRFMSLARERNPGLYPGPERMRWEVHYNSFHPFGWAWKIYLIAVICGLLIWVFQRPLHSGWMYRLSWVFAILGMGLHLYGFALRIYLAGRAPVSNMYETVVWVGLGAVVFAMIFELLYKWRFVLLAGNLVATLCMILSDRAPTVLDPSLQPLEAVLRSNFWLTTHVLTITLSYAAFFLSFALGFIGLFSAVRKPDLRSPQLRAISLAAYRGIQVGVAFLAPGIILGGIWADYSWGRFWGWDPKETWALIALLGYLAILHAKLAGYIREIGLLASSIVTMSLVIMAWYGVNFVLGAGLHTYGFGAGGLEYVSGFVALSILYTIFMTIFAKSRASSPATTSRQKETEQSS
ncbi:MAG: cytochrome c biogenesis protein CcsA, partial [Bdellovibrio sp.]